MRYFILNAANEPVEVFDVVQWGMWFETADRTVSKDFDEGDPERRVQVSTVFLGLDHSFVSKGPPVLWETMVFGGPLDGEQRRYTSHAAAMLGHQEMCARVGAAQQAERIAREKGESLECADGLVGDVGRVQSPRRLSRSRRGPRAVAQP